MATTGLSKHQALATPSVDEIVRALVEVVPTPVVVADDSGHYVYVNPAARAFFGRPAEDLVGTEVIDSIVPREREEVGSYLCSTATAEPGRRSIAGEREVLLHHTPMALGGKLLLIGIVEDVTENRRVRREAVALAQSAASLAVNRSLDATLDALAQSIVETTSAVACGIYLLEPDGNLRTAGTFGLPRGYAAAADAAQTRGAPRAAIRAMEAHATVIDEDVVTRRLADPRFSPLHDLIREVPWSVIVSLPLMHHDAAIGALNAYYPSGQRPPEIDMSFLRAMADQATSAVDYARLLSASRDKVALEERQRLARDLHDSVSQAVYGIALGARSAQEMLAKDPSQLREPLDYIVRLSEAALAEMRALIFELRPEALEREGLIGALKHHTAVLRSRHGITVEEVIAGEPTMSWESKQALYRIAQEALHNAGRHARATRVRVALNQDDAEIRLEVWDNGVGFDPQSEHPGHFGLNTMRERATELGGRLEIESRAEAGTKIRAIIPASRSNSSEPIGSPKSR
ncbi:MAG: PAS domain S-box protein [Chloroflexi bacterium]|nr:MAG: PAS domain S-box protein [Chloroflexota bacterium]